MSLRGNYIINIAGICNQSISDRTYLVQHDLWSYEKYVFKYFINLYSIMSVLKKKLTTNNILPSSHYV